MPVSSYSPQVEFDIVIVGGAMAGATLALALCEYNRKNPDKILRIALVEAKTVDAAHPGFDARAIAIADGAIRELKRLGIWQHIQPLGSAIKHIHVSDRGHFGMTTLDAESLNLAAFGQVVELASVGKVLMAQLQDYAKQYPHWLTLFCPASVASITAHEGHHQLQLTTQEQLNAKLLVAADGGFSKVRQQLKQPTEQVDFNQAAIVANVVTDSAHQGWAYERFTEHGPIALLPMADCQGQQRLSLVWAMPPNEVESRKALPKEAFLQQLQQAFGYRCGRFTDIGQLSSYPLVMSYMPRPIYHRCVFVGNAAQTLHPIAGQGFNLGLRDISTLFDVLTQARSNQARSNQARSNQARSNQVNSNQVNSTQSERAHATLHQATTGNVEANHLKEPFDIGAHALIHAYYQQRQVDRDRTINHIECLVRGFSNQYYPLVAGRNIGLRLLSWLPPLKRPVAEVAMGWR
ncbi:2-octaprenyl-6-methoxyphenyl hydroxylase [Shewanella intestini]|uniref:2-octaprenyl-6-methoxyphenyl hydroxylase n=1 Tax=Shewanella TaxID=22 RepID=UPI001E5E0BB8|nr:MULTISPECIES: 2-octaprenyl-6-methoxyphenyl hydroxylase [Shewanella]